MLRSLAALAVCTLWSNAAVAQATTDSIPLGVTGTVRFHARFPSQLVPARNIEVWLPPKYEENRRARYPVVYMHDGQNVFAPATSFTRIDWAVDEVMTRLIAERRVRPAIIVAIWNSNARFDEYGPRKPQADAYLKFIVEELKPFIDSTYRTRQGRADTFTMGSSMGGLIAAYAVIQHPDVFGGAACLSTHWPAVSALTAPLLANSMPKPGSHRFYFDHGTATLDSLYAPLQAIVNRSIRAAGYVEGRDWTSRVFEGADHSERSWRLRVHEPLTFLIGAR